MKNLNIIKSYEEKKPHSSFLKMGLAAATIVGLTGFGLGVQLEDVRLIIASPALGVAMAAATFMIDAVNKYSDESDSLREFKMQHHEKIMDTLKPKAVNNITELRNNFGNKNINSVIKTVL